MQRHMRMFGTPITLLVLLGILVFGVKWGWKNAIAPVPPPPLVPCVEQSVGANLTSKQVTVKVYNGGRKHGLAGKVSAQLKAKGFNVTKTGNTDEKVTQTTIVGVSPDSPEVKLVAGFFKGAKVIGDGRVDHTVEVRVGPPTTGFVETAPTSLAVKSGKVCLPAPSATPTTVG